MKVNLIQPLRTFKNCIISQEINSQRVNELTERSNSRFNSLNPQEKKITVNPKKLQMRKNHPSVKVVQLSTDELPKVKQTSIILYEFDRLKESEKKESRISKVSRPSNKSISISEMIQIIKDKIIRKEHVDHLIKQFASLNTDSSSFSFINNKKSRNMNNSQGKSLTESISVVNEKNRKEFLNTKSSLYPSLTLNSQGNTQHMTITKYTHYNTQNNFPETKDNFKKRKLKLIAIPKIIDKKYPKLCLISHQGLTELKTQKKSSSLQKNFKHYSQFHDNNHQTFPVMSSTQNASFRRLYVNTNKSDLNLNSRFYSNLNAKSANSFTEGNSKNIYKTTSDPYGSFYNEIKSKSREVIRNNEMERNNKIKILNNIGVFSF